MAYGLYTNERYVDANLRKINPKTGIELREFAESFLRRDPKRHLKKPLNLFMHGNHRIGKTWLLHAIANFFINDCEEKNVYFISAEQLAKHFFERDKFPKTEETWINVLASKRVLLLDDVGQDNYTKTEFIPKRFDAFLRWRFNHNLTTIISSNSTLVELQMQYNESLCEFVSGEFQEFEIESNINMSEVMKKQEKAATKTER